jgi:hypothetical protein
MSGSGLVVQRFRVLKMLSDSTPSERALLNFLVGVIGLVCLLASSAVQVQVLCVDYLLASLC